MYSMKFKLSSKIIRDSVKFFPLLIFINSFILEFVFNFLPCNLCLIERYHYLALFVFAMFRLNIITIIVCISGVCVSVYHKLLQMGFTNKCPHFFRKNSIESFMNEIQNSVPCSTVSKILNIDLVYFNIAFFTFFILYIVFAKKVSL